MCIRDRVWGGAQPPRMIYCNLQHTYIVFPDTGVLRMVGPSVFPEKEVISEWLVLQYFQIHRLYQNGGSVSISREAGYIRMVGPSVFPDSRVEKWSLGTQNALFRTDFKSETTSKYILDIPWVFPAHFPYIKHWFSNKIGQNQLKSRKIDIF